MLNSLQTKKGPGTSFQAAFFVEFLDEIISFGMTQTDQISLTDHVYSLSYSIKCISCFMRRCLMMS